ncbi:MAG: acyltransferase [Cyclobacteriaceae bacterium]|nr:acyltransferase [Cyclobacteriaceae bacterium]
MKYSKTLDGLRGIAIIMVMLFHFNFVFEFGWAGVQLFFVLSGYLITSILLEEKENSLGYYLKRFYWRRTLRIFPLYYAYLVLVGIVFLIAKQPSDFLDLLPFLSTYTFNLYPLFKTYSYHDFYFTHFWSLSVEEQFYLIWPLVIFFSSQKQLRVVLIAIIVGAPISRWLLDILLQAKDLPDYYVGQTVYRFTLGQWDGFAIGALIPVFGLTKRITNTRAPLLYSLQGMLVIGFVNMYLYFEQGSSLSLSSLGYPIAETANGQHLWSYTVLNVFFLFLILYAQNPGTGFSLLNRFLGSSWLVFTGKISYGLYVYHWIIWMAYGKYLSPIVGSVWIGLVIYLSICVIVASVSFYLLEKPLLSWKDKLYYNVKESDNNRLQ